MGSGADELGSLWLDPTSVSSVESFGLISNKEEGPSVSVHGKVEHEHGVQVRKIHSRERTGSPQAKL